MDSEQTEMGDLPIAELINQAFQQWQTGQQQPAIETIRPYADRGDAWALALITWFMHQTGDPGWRNAIPYAERAIHAGYPYAINYVIGSMQGDPGLGRQDERSRRFGVGRAVSSACRDARQRSCLTLLRTTRGPSGSLITIYAGQSMWGE